MFRSHDRRSMSHKARLVALLTTTALVAANVAANPAFAQSLPSGGQVAAGNVTIGTPINGTLTIDQTSANAVVNWQRFNIGAGNAVTFVQPDASSAILNRVTGSTTTSIAGSLSANGQVYLVNPNGIAITATGTVNAGAFVASTLGISDEDFMAGKRRFTGNGASAAVTNAGAITIDRGGYLALIGGSVANSGLITVPMGKAALGSGEQATLDLSGDGFLQVAIPTKAEGREALVSNSGTIAANGGAVQLTAAAARDMARQAVNLSGTVEAKGVAGKSGDIILFGDEGTVAVSGTLDAGNATGKGGAVTVTGRDVKLATARVETSGATGGGKVRIGGERQGKGTLKRAETLSVDATTVINADARASGKGGDVVLWSDHLTSFAGNITARGGATSGDGGEAEVSGKARLNYTGRTDLSSANGTFGTLLLDPYNVTISTGADTGGFTASGNDSVINATTLQTALATGNVTISTGASGTQAGDITVAAPLSWTASTRLTLDAAGSIAINAPITVAGGGQVTLNHSTANAITGGLSFENGSALTFSDGQAGQALSINGNAYTLLRSMDDIDRIDTTGLSGHYALAGSLNAGGTTYGRAIIGSETGSPFTGTLEGLGHTIANLTIESTNHFVGLIGYLDSGTVRDVGLIGGSVNSSGQNIGGLLGSSQYGTVRNAYNTGTVGGSYQTGGLVGLSSGTISNSYATGAVNGAGDVGGLVGATFDGAVSNVYATGAVSGGRDYVGGLVGVIFGGTVSNAYATGAVNSVSANVGGFVGYNSGIVTKVYATGAVSGASAVGGLAGASDYTGKFLDAYATGAVSGNFDVGGLLGVGNASVLKKTYATGLVSVTGQITDRSSNFGGLVGSLANAEVSNSYASGAVSGAHDVGGLIGFSSGNKVINAYTSGAVSGIKNVGGLLGSSMSSTKVDAAYATGSVIGSGEHVGGLVGYNDKSSITGGYATGAVSGSDNVGGLVGNNAQGGYVAGSYATGTVSGNSGVGGLVGNNASRVVDSYATGAVSGSGVKVGGLVGFNGDTVTNGFWDIDTSGRTTDGLDSTATGLTTAQFQSGGASALGANFAGGANGLYPYLKSFHPNGVQAISGFATTGAGAAAAGAQVGLYQGGSQIGGAVSTGANGYYYAIVPTATLAASGNGFGQTLTLSGATAPSGLSYSDALSPDTNGNLFGLSIASGRRDITTAAPSWSALANGQASTFGAAPYAALAATLGSTPLRVNATQVNGFTLDSQLSLGAGDLSLTASGSLTLANRVAANTITFVSTSNFTNTAGANALSAANRWLVYSADPAGNALGGLTPDFIQYNAAYGDAPAQTGGNGLLYRRAPVLTVGLTGTVTKTYDGTTAATLSASNYAMAGVVGDDVVTLTTAAGTSFDTANAGTGKTVSANGIGIASTSNGGATVYGYQLASTTATGDIGTIDRRPITVTVDAQSRVYGAANPALRYTATGLINNDTLTGTLATAATATSNVGDHAITQGSLAASANYAITSYNGANLTVTPATLTYRANALSRVYGDVDQALGGSVTGFVNGETQGSATTGSLAFTSAATGTSNVGDYAVEGAGLSANNGNYVFTQAAGNAGALSITPRPITVTAHAVSRVYGDANPALRYTATGVITTDTLTGALATAATATSNVATYAITQGTLGNANYAISYNGADLSVTARSIMVTADARSRAYGDANPALTYRLSGAGLVNGDTLTGALATAATATSEPGTYSITQGSLTASANYRMDFRAGALTVDRAASPETGAMASIAAASFDTGRFMPLRPVSADVAENIHNDRLLIADPRFDGTVVCLAGDARCIVLAP